MPVPSVAEDICKYKLKSRLLLISGLLKLWVRCKESLSRSLCRSSIRSRYHLKIVFRLPSNKQPQHLVNCTHLLSGPNLFNLLTNLMELALKGRFLNFKHQLRKFSLMSKYKKILMLLIIQRKRNNLKFRYKRSHRNNQLNNNKLY